MKQGAFFTNIYKDIFSEYGYDKSEIKDRINCLWNNLFYGDEDVRIYYPADDGMGYVLDTGNIDVRTEGMSYGMMMAVQMDKKEIFDSIWKWVLKYMWHKNGKYKGYFAWSLNPDGTRLAQGPAPDGEEYFAMALFFASHRWGDEHAPFDYSVRARAILKECVHKGEKGKGHPMWNRENKLIKFVPKCNFTDPSYHLPHFYELFSLWADESDKDFWKQAAEESRKFLVKACHPVTGLAPEYSYYDGSPHFNSEHSYFYSDAYRVALNIALDSVWFGPSEWAGVQAKNIQDFFSGIKTESELYTYTVEGERLEQKALHPVGLIATNAASALAYTSENSKKCVELFYSTPLRRDKRRYYDNCLYFFSLLALAGQYKIW